jgi:hypothetical protein
MSATSTPCSIPVKDQHRFAFSNSSMACPVRKSTNHGESGAAENRLSLTGYQHSNNEEADHESSETDERESAWTWCPPSTSKDANHAESEVEEDYSSMKNWSSEHRKDANYSQSETEEREDSPVTSRHQGMFIMCCVQ